MQPGQRIRDCVIEKHIGAGGMGEVWRAYHRALRRHVAVKLIFQRDHTFQQRFQREAEAMSRLHHPHIVPIHEVFVVGTSGYLVMGLVEGGSLADLGRVSCAAALQLAAQILDALNFAHQQGVVHRDVKPSNILVDRNGRAYVTDFGIALVAGKQRITRLTRSGTAIGTPEYMSPEQITTPEDIDHRTDVYSFGCVLYELLAGQPPFGSRDNGTTDFDLMHAHVRQAPVPIRRRNPDVDRNTERVITQALAKDRERRFAGCGEMAQALLRGTRAVGSAAAVMPFAHQLFSFQGRITRSQFCLTLLPIVLLFALTAFVVPLSSTVEGVLILAINLVVGVWASAAIAIKRWHDLDRPSWWLLSGALVIPLVWIGFSLLFQEGTNGENQFGPGHL